MAGEGRISATVRHFLSRFLAEVAPACRRVDRNNAIEDVLCAISARRLVEDRDIFGHFAFASRLAQEFSMFANYSRGLIDRKFHFPTLYKNYNIYILGVGIRRIFFNFF